MSTKGVTRSTLWGAATSKPVLFACGLVCAVVLGWLGVSRATELSCPAATPCVTVEALAAGAPLPQTLRIYDRQGGLLARVGGPRRWSVPMDRVPRDLVDAFVAVEDHRFWQHEGIDPIGVVRAGVRNVVMGELSEGASTIPMQLVRTVWATRLHDAGPWRRKLIEAVHAPRLVDELGHERVLNLYLNAIYLGDGVFGVEEAARHYFGRGVGDLSLAQIATLVGMTRAPERYDPREHPGRVQLLRDAILDHLVAKGVVDPHEAAAAKREPVRTVRLESQRSRRPVDRHVVAAVLRRLQDMPPEVRKQHGLSVHTTLDPVVQEAARAATETQLAAIEAGRFGDLDTGADPSAVLDVGAVALDARTGDILAWIGGRDFDRSQFDRVEQARRQVASLVKPFLVALAIEHGAGILDMISTEGGAVDSDDGWWIPADHVRQPRIPIREGLVLSSNRAAARLARDVGLDRVAMFGAGVGLGERLAAVPSTAIGTFSASLLDVATAYTVFSNGGVRLPPRLIDKVEGWDGQVLFERAPAGGVRVMSEATAFSVLDAMRAVVDRGTGSSVRQGFRGPAAGKTGTSDGTKDAWFLGMTPRLVAGVWFGFDLPRTIVDGRDAGDLAAPAWSDWMRRLQAPEGTRARWSPPLTVERLVYDPSFGDVFRADCPDAGSEPYQLAWVARDRYSTIACPEDGIRGRMERLRTSMMPQPLTPIPLLGSAGRSPRPEGRPDPTR